MKNYKFFSSLWASNGMQATRAVIPEEPRPTFYASKGCQQFQCGNIENTVFQTPITYIQIANVNNLNVQTQGGIPVSQASLIQPALYWQSQGG